MEPSITRAEMERIAALYKPRRWRIVRGRAVNTAYTSTAHFVPGYRGIISVPTLRDAAALFLWLHEFGHVNLGHFDDDKPGHLEEYEAENYALRIFQAHGLNGYPLLGRPYVRRMILADEANGVKIFPHVRRWANR